MTGEPKARLAGLCDRCEHCQRVEAVRGSVFMLCRRHGSDLRFSKYPRLPVLRCSGYAERASPELRPALEPEP